MAGAGRLLSGVIVVAILWIAADRFVLGPMRVDRALDALPRVTLDQALGPVGAFDAIVFLDDREGWFLIDRPEDRGDLLLGLAGAAPGDMSVSRSRTPVYCGDDRGRILWGVREAQIVEEIAVCDPAALDLGALAQVAAPIRMERDFLTGDQIAILRDEIDADPSRIAVTLPADVSDHPFERVVALPWIWQGTGDGRPFEAALGAGRMLLTGALSDHDGAFKIEASLQPTVLPPSGPAAMIDTGEGPVIVDGLSAIARPVFRVQCEEVACAALDAISVGDTLDPWRNVSLLDRALENARPVSTGAPDVALPDRSDLLNDSATLPPAEVSRHVVRIARRL